jgi:hypothetical protein
MGSQHALPRSQSIRTSIGIVVMVTLFFVTSLIIPEPPTDSTYTPLHNYLDGSERAKATFGYPWWKPPPTAEEIPFIVIGSILLIPAIVYILTKRM